MASLTISISEWCPDWTSYPTCLAIANYFGFIGCNNGQILCFDRNTFNVEMIMKSSGYPIIDIQLGSFQIDQPFGSIPVILTFDSIGYHAPSLLRS
jgi:hypothetical protein